MDQELLLNELAEIVELLMVLHNHDPSNDIVEESYERMRNLRDEIEESLS